MKNSICLIIISLLVITGCGTKDKHVQQENTRYTCPMHPQIVSNTPGTCPICKMDLVPLSGHGQVSSSDSLKFLVKPTNELVQANIATVKPQSGKRFGENVIRGVINYNSNNWKSISSRISGRIERLYVKYNYQPVSKGQKIMDIYSPDLANAQQELLFLKQNNEPALMESARRKLRLLGMSDTQIASTIKTGKVDYTISIYSPYSGYLAEGSIKGGSQAGTAQAGSTMITDDDNSAMGGNAMSGGATPSSAAVPDINGTSPVSVREGQYVGAGQKLFDLISASSVWAEFYLRPEQLNVVKRGTEVEITAADDPMAKIRTSVSLVQPYYNEGSNFSVARALIANSGQKWRVGQLVNVSLDSDGTQGNWIPRKSVLQLGGRQVVFVKQEGGFEPVFIATAKRMGDWVDIGNSLPGSSEIAENAWFLVDSESFIKPDPTK